MESISKTVKKQYDQIVPSPAVNSNNNTSNTVNSNSNTTNTVNSIDEWLLRMETTRDGIAYKLSEDLGDKKSLQYYKVLTHNHDPRKLLDALAIFRNAKANGVHIKFPPAYFQGILRNWGIQTKFSKSGGKSI